MTHVGQKLDIKLQLCNFPQQAPTDRSAKLVQIVHFLHNVSAVTVTETGENLTEILTQH